MKTIKMEFNIIVKCEFVWCNCVVYLNCKDNVLVKYSPVHKTLPSSSLQMHFISVRFLWNGRYITWHILVSNSTFIYICISCIKNKSKNMVNISVLLIRFILIWILIRILFMKRIRIHRNGTDPRELWLIKSNNIDQSNLYKSSNFSILSCITFFCRRVAKV